MSHFETFVESNFPLASDTSKRAARALYFELREQRDLTSTDIPSLVDRYEDALGRLRMSHNNKENELFELAFANDRRGDYVSTRNN